MTKSIYEIMTCNNVLNKLKENSVKYSIGTAYKINKLIRQFNEIEDMMHERWDDMFGEGYVLEQLNENQILTFNGTLMTAIDVDLFGLKFDDFITEERMSLSLSETETLEKFFI